MIISFSRMEDCGPVVAADSRRLLDTDILSEIIKGKNAAVAGKAASYLAEQGRFTTSAVSVAEIVYGYGAQRSPVVVSRVPWRPPQSRTAPPAYAATPQECASPDGHAGSGVQPAVCEKSPES